MDKASIMQSFRTSEEKLLFARLYDNFLSAQKNLRPTFSVFLDPASLSKFARIFEINMPPQFKMLIFGGAEHCERQMMCFTPEDNVRFPISCIEISYNKKFSRELTHRDFLGSILALGIDRKKIGDIVLGESAANAYVAEDMRDFIIYNLERVGKTAVTVKETVAAAKISGGGKIIRITVPSLRIDAVAAACLHLSRATVTALVESEKVFINWRLAEKPSKTVSEGDFVSIRGYGRLVIHEVAGKSKKDKFILNVEVSS